MSDAGRTASYTLNARAAGARDADARDRAGAGDSLHVPGRNIIARHPLAAIVVGAVLLRLALTPLYAYLPNGLLDEGFWKHWMEQIHREGFLNIFRSSDTDYVGYHWVLWLLSAVYDVMGGPYTQTTPSLHILVKMPSIAFDVALIVAVHRATAALLREAGGDAASRLPLLAAGVIALHPAVVYDSAVWAQTDSAITAAMLFAIVFAVAARPAAAGLSYALGFAVKPHPVIIGPVLALALFRSGGVRAWAVVALTFAAVAAAVLGPWILHGELGRIIDVYELLFTKDHQRLSELAWNGWWIGDHLGDPRPGDAIVDALPWLTFRRAGLALSVAATALGFAYAWKRPGLHGALVAAAYQAFAFYALPIASHERYLYPFIALLLPVAVVDRRWLWLYVPVSATFFLNLVVVAPPVKELADDYVYSEFGAWIGGVNMLLFAAFSAVLARAVALSLRDAPLRRVTAGRVEAVS